MENGTGLFSVISRSGFVRSVITRVLAIFIIVSIVIAAFAFSSFTSEIRRAILNDRQKQLAAVEKTISGRMDEVTSICYNIGKDSAFYLEPVETDPKTGREMSEALNRYVVGNSFIEHLAYCRAAEPDVLYTARGERSLSEFFIAGFGMEKAAAFEVIDHIHNDADMSIKVYGEGNGAYFAYSYPLPELAAKPLAHVLIMIPVSEVRPLLETLLTEGRGETVVFDARGVKIYGAGAPEDDIDLTKFLKSGGEEEDFKSPAGQRYVLQKTVSETNGWTYVSVIRQDDTLSGLANRQLEFIIFVLLALLAAIVIMLFSIIAQYKPISKLAAQVAGKENGDAPPVDERALLSHTIATLRDDSQQKRKYETAYYEAEAASKAKSAFLSSMSHDIRTPMNAIVGMTAIARKHIGDQAYVDDCLEKVQTASAYLLDIINNVLDMSRIESGRIPIAEEPVLIPALIDSVVSLMTTSVEAKSQTLDVDMSGLRNVAVVGDNIHIIQVFVNILSNAVKFTPEGGRITLRVAQTEADDGISGDYSFSFTDTGVGIPPEFIDRVFDTFSRADGPVAARTEGTGLGMAIAKKLVELMGGTISCESELGSGTTFTVAMRMRYVDAEEAMSLADVSERPRASASPDTTSELGGRRILLAEDNAMNREIACRIIAETGAEVIEAGDGKEALEEFLTRPEGYFDLILMDIQMPVMNGYESAEAIRSCERADAATIPIYALTANTFDEDVRHVREAGMNGHIGKPYSPATLYQVLASALKHSES